MIWTTKANLAPPPPADIYVDRKPDKAENPAICHCVPPKANEDGCGESCINRFVPHLPFGRDLADSTDGDQDDAVLVRPQDVPFRRQVLQQASRAAGGRSRGQERPARDLGALSIPRSRTLSLTLYRQTGDRGFGLKTMVPIKAGQYVSQYLGEVRFLFVALACPLTNPTIPSQIITRDESYRRVLTTYKDSKSYYFLDYDGHEVIDAVRSLLPPSFPSTQS